MGKRVNTTLAERKAFLKEHGYTEEQMQTFWNECIEINHKIKMLSQIGRNWTDLTVSQMEELPGLKEKTLKQLAEKEEAAKRQAELDAEIEAQKKYYNEHFEEIMCDKILKGEELTERELSLITNYEVSREEGENRRWSRTIHSVVKLNEHYFMVVWEQGLTEMQENEFYDQPYEVEKHTYEKTLTVTEWVAKGQEQQSVNQEDTCEWIEYDYRTICPKNHDKDNPYWRIPIRKDVLKFCPYCGKHIVINGKTVEDYLEAHI